MFPQKRPTEILPFFELASRDALKLLLTVQGATELENTAATIPNFQVILRSNQNTQSLRNLTAEHVNKLIKVPGIVISCTKIRAKATEVFVQCTKCNNTKRIPCKGPMGGVSIPTHCDGTGVPRAGPDGNPLACGRDTFVVVADNCEYVDQQTLKMQESPEVSWNSGTTIYQCRSHSCQLIAQSEIR